MAILDFVEKNPESIWIFFSNIFNMGIHTLLHNAVRKNTITCVKTHWAETKEIEILCSLFPIDPEVYFFQTRSGSDIAPVAGDIFLDGHI